MAPARNGARRRLSVAYLGKTIVAAAAHARIDAGDLTELF